MEQINLNLIPNGVNPVAHCKQYDVGRTFRCNLFEGTSVYTLDGTETVECEVHKPDGNLVTLGLTNTGSTYVDVTTTLQMCACSGESLAAIKITSGGVEIGSLNFVLYCERSPLEGGITSDSGIYNLETQVSSLVATEVANQYDSANVIFDAEPTAGHGNGYAVTSEGIVDYVNPEETIENVSIASFDNGGDGVPVKELIVGIEPVQASGTPTPSSPIPITGHTDVNATVTGKNMFSYDLQLYDGYWLADGLHVGTPTTYESLTTWGFYLVPVKVGEKVTLSGMQALGGVYGAFINTTPSNVVSRYLNANVNNTFTVPEGATHMGIIINRGGNRDPKTEYPNAQMEYGSTATTFEAFKSITTSTISLGQTVYGGELNVTTGELTITHAILEKTIASMNNSDSYPGWQASGVRAIIGGGLNETLTNLTMNIGSTVGVNTNGAVNDTLWLPTHIYGKTQTEWMTDYPNLTVQIVLELATPTTTTLTPTEVATVLGYNNIYADTGDVVSVTYYKYNMMGGFNLIKSQVGTLSQLTTTDKDSLVDAINEVDGDVGDLSTLTTTANSDLVSAVNEVDGDVGDLSTLTTTDKSSVVSAINELDSGKADASTTLAGYGITDAYTTSTIDTLLGGNSAIRVQTSNGNFSGLVGNGQVWLIVVQRLTVDATCVLVVNNSNGTIVVKEVVKDSGMAYVTNSQGTVSITYSNSGNYVCGSAYKLYG